jgi:hypothetical protein
VFGDAARERAIGRLAARDRRGRAGSREAIIRGA